MKYKGKYENSAAPEKRGFKRLAPQAIVLLLLVAVLAISAVAWLVAQTDTVTNQFTIAQVSCKVDETFTDGIEKKNVSIENTSDIYAYIRVAIVATWEDEDGNIIPLSADLDDLNITWGSTKDTDWLVKDGYYYYKFQVAPEANTTALIDKATVTTANGYRLNLQILCEAIQATPTTAVQEAWHVSVDNDGKLS